MSGDDEPVGIPRTAEELFDPSSRKPEVLPIDTPPNSADPKQLRTKAVRDKQKEITDENDLRAVLSTPEGVRLVAKIIAEPCGWNMPYFHPSNSTMCEVAGRRSVAYQLESWICNVDLKFWEPVRRELEKYRPKPEKKKPGSAP